MILRRLLLSVAAVAVAVCVSAQNVFMVQGHERPDITARMAQMPARAAADEAVEDTDFSFDDIEFWVGTGSDSAALVIDWYDDKGGTLVWGYLFDAADDAQNTGYAMVAAVAKADPRFVLLVHGTDIGNTIAGLGYDLDNSGDMRLTYTDPDTKETTEHTPVDGIVTTGEYNYDDWSASDADDHWVSGWYNGYWSYQVKDDRAESFSYSGLGASSRRLQNGSWDGWAYQGFDNPSMTGVIPRAPWTAAESPVQLPEGEEPTDGNTYWGQMYKNSVHQSIVALGMANKAENLSVKWEMAFTGSGFFDYPGQPIIAGDYMYITEGKKIHKVFVEDGTAVLTAEMSGSMGFFAMITYGDGKIFVPYSNGSLEAFDAVTLKPLWKTEETGMQQLCPVVYHDGYVYTGQWKTIGKGKFYCISTADDDPLRSDEVKAPLWESDDAGFYWSGATIVGDNIYFGGDDGVMQARDRKTGELIDSYAMENTTLRSGTSYDSVSRRLFFTAKEAAKLVAIRINGDGTFDKESVLMADVAGEATTTPTVYNGRVYATSGMMTSNGMGGLDVYDFNGESLEHVYAVDMGGASQSTPVVCTAYAHEGNGNKVYIYVCLNNSTGDMVCIEDFKGNTEPKIAYKWTAPKTQYCTHSVVVDQYGTIYYKNDSKGFWALESRLEADGLYLDRDGLEMNVGGTMQLTAMLLPLGVDAELTWSSSDESVATVSADGTVTAVAEGEAVIMVKTTDGGFTAECKVTVKDVSAAVDGVFVIEGVYPNPFESVFHITVSEDVTMYIYDANGRMLMTEKLHAGENAVDASSLTPGIYIVRCGNDTYRVIKH